MLKVRSSDHPVYPKEDMTAEMALRTDCGDSPNRAPSRPPPQVDQFYFGDLPRKVGQHSTGVDTA